MRIYILGWLLLIAACSVAVDTGCPSSAIAGYGGDSGTGVHTACYLCHKSHLKLKPDMVDCLQCHTLIMKEGNHEIHAKASAMQCMDCHKPHIWRVSNDKTQKACTRCHELKGKEGAASP